MHFPVNYAEFIYIGTEEKAEVRCKSCPDGVRDCGASPVLYTTCIDSYYKDTICKPCSFMCRTCSSYKKCTECIAGSFLKSDKCKICDDKISHCAICTGDYNSMTCNTCMAGYRLNGNKCEKCSVANCLDC